MIKERKKKSNKRYTQSPKGRKAVRKAVKRYFQTSKGKATSKRYQQSLKVKSIHKKYRQSLKGKVMLKRASARRRQFGFVPLNEWFEGCEGHHIDFQRVIYIPKKLHRSVWHSVFLDINMDKINKLAFDYLNKRML